MNWEEQEGLTIAVQHKSHVIFCLLWITCKKTIKKRKEKGVLIAFISIVPINLFFLHYLFFLLIFIFILIWFICFQNCFYKVWSRFPILPPLKFGSSFFFKAWLWFWFWFWFFCWVQISFVENGLFINNKLFHLNQLIFWWLIKISTSTNHFMNFSIDVKEFKGEWESNYCDKTWESRIC